MQKNGKGKQVLLITDVAGYSKVALSAMLPVLTHLESAALRITENRHFRLAIF